MRFRPSYLIGLLLIQSCSLCLFQSTTVSADTQSRETPLVRAVANCKAAVVNLRGRKTVPDESKLSKGSVKHVNGMGTGVIIDPRGYILTNYHVVQGVKKIEVTTGDKTKTTGRLIAHDPETDLAIIKIDLPKTLQTIDIGTSSDLMLAETVAAVGNAYGYEHTVTVGIISQLGRTVQVNDDQVYRNLIQTDAPINPGNSGGPLLNLDGKMIGINVAVRIGAQGIAFAIPANEAMEVASRLMSEVATEIVYTGINATTVFQKDQPHLLVKTIDSGSPADRAGLQRGDLIETINGTPVSRSLDLQRALVAAVPNTDLKLVVSNNGKSEQVAIKINRSRGSSPATDPTWSALGLKVIPASESEMANRHPNYRRGLRVTKVRGASPADKEGIVAGDVLVAMHGWKTESLENLAYILEQKDIKDQKEFMFYILRDKEPFWGQMRIASEPGSKNLR